MTAEPMQQVFNYRELMDLIRARVEAVGVPHEQLEEIMGLTPGLLGKILGAAEVRRMGLAKIWPILEWLGLRMGIVQHLDIAATRDEMSANIRPRERKGPARGRLKKTLSPAIIRAAAQQYGAMGRSVPKRFGIKKGLTQKQFNRLQKKKARARWATYRAAKATQQYIGTPARQ